MNYNDGKFCIWLIFWIAVFFLVILPAVISLLGNLKDAIKEYRQKKKNP